MNKTEKSTPFDMRKKVIASVTQEGWKVIPHVSYIYEADATGIYEEFKRLKDLGRYRKNITFNTLLLRIIIEGIKSARQLNAEVRYSTFLTSGRVTVKDKININMPVLLSDGAMVTVNLRDMENKSLEEMAEQIEDIMERTRSCDMEASLLKVGLKDTFRNLRQGRLVKVIGRSLGIAAGHKRKAAKTLKNKPGELLSKEILDQGTITVSNLGAAVKGTRGRTALLDIVPPQVCAIGIGVLQEEPRVYPAEGKASRIGIRKVIPFTIAFDHRALDFGEVAPFINRLEEIFNTPRIIGTW